MRVCEGLSLYARVCTCECWRARALVHEWGRDELPASSSQSDSSGDVSSSSHTHTRLARAHGSPSTHSLPSRAVLHTRSLPPSRFPSLSRSVFSSPVLPLCFSFFNHISTLPPRLRLLFYRRGQILFHVIDTPH